jgi:hypothetical protein
LPVLALSEPTLEIGVVEGDERYVFGSIESVLRLSDGSVAVSDPVNTRIAIYDANGGFLRSWGVRGGGPGEFRSLSRIYPMESDSLMAADNFAARLSVFGTDGGYARQFDGLEVSRDSTFRLDSWLYGRFWVDGALDASSRARVRAALDRLPPPRDAPGYRTARVMPGGAIWIREPGSPAADATWIELGPGGDPVAIVVTPAGFTPLHVDGDEVLGRWLGPTDVEFVRAYPIVTTEEVRPTPPWMQAGAAPSGGSCTRAWTGPHAPAGLTRA